MVIWEPYKSSYGDENGAYRLKFGLWSQIWPEKKTRISDFFSHFWAILGYFGNFSFIFWSFGSRKSSYGDQNGAYRLKFGLWSQIWPKKKLKFQIFFTHFWAILVIFQSFFGHLGAVRALTETQMKHMDSNLGYGLKYDQKKNSNFRFFHSLLGDFGNFSVIFWSFESSQSSYGDQNGAYRLKFGLWSQIWPKKNTRISDFFHSLLGYFGDF